MSLLLCFSPPYNYAVPNLEVSWAFQLFPTPSRKSVTSHLQSLRPTSCCICCPPDSAFHEHCLHCIMQLIHTQVKILTMLWHRRPYAVHRTCNSNISVHPWCPIVKKKLTLLQQRELPWLAYTLFFTMLCKGTISNLHSYNFSMTYLTSVIAVQAGWWIHHQYCHGIHPQCDLRCCDCFVWMWRGLKEIRHGLRIEGWATHDTVVPKGNNTYIVSCSSTCTYNVLTMLYQLNAIKSVSRYRAVGFQRSTLQCAIQCTVNWLF